MKSQICVPILVTDAVSMVQQLSSIPVDKVDLLEFRLDYCQDINDLNQVDEIFKLINQYTNLSYILTLRTQQEGGAYQGDFEQYARIYQYIVDHYQFYALDIEWHYAKQLDYLIKMAKKNKIKCIISYHNFKCVPSHHELVEVYDYMCQTSASIYKFAVTPLEQKDLIRLLAFTQELSDHAQYIIIGMDQLGLITRIMPSLFKSMLTFASVTYSSAPGQITVDQLTEVLNILER